MSSKEVTANNIFQLHRKIVNCTDPQFRILVPYRSQVRSELFKVLSLQTPSPFVPEYYDNRINDFDIDISGKLALVGATCPNTIALYNLEFLSYYRSESLLKKPLITKKLDHLSISQVQWYPHDSGMFVSCIRDKEIAIWDSENYCIAARFPSESRINTFQMSSVAMFHSIVALGLQNKQLRLLDLRTRNTLLELTGNRDPIQSVCWSKFDDYMLFSGDECGRISAWDIRQMASLVYWLNKYADDDENDVSSNYQVFPAHDSSIVSMCALSRHNHLVSLGADQQIKVWNISSGKRVSTIYINIRTDYYKLKKYSLASTAQQPETYLMNDLILAPGYGVPMSFTLERGELRNLSFQGVPRTPIIQIIKLHPYYPVVLTSGNGFDLNVWRCTFPRLNCRRTEDEEYYLDTWSGSSE